MQIAVFGRGKSLIRTLAKRWDKCYFVNDMTEELIRMETIPTAQDCIHVCGRKGATVMENSIYISLAINRVIVNAMHENLICNIKRFKRVGIQPEIRPSFMNSRGYPPWGWNAILKGKEKSRTSSNGNCWPTTGMFAIDLALTENKPKEIHLFGFDLYRKNYLIKKNRPHQTQVNPKIKMMKICLEKLVKEYRNTTFYCYSDIDIKEENWVKK